MSMYNDIVWREKGNEELNIANSKVVADYARRFAHGHWSFLGPGSNRKCCGTHTYKPNGKWGRVAEDMMIIFSESGHPIFSGSSALEQGALRSKRKGNLSIHFCSGHVGRAGLQNFWLFRKYRETCCSEQFRDHGDANRIVDNEQNTISPCNSSLI